MNKEERNARFHEEVGKTSFNDDTERIYQSFALRRLAGVTQVIAATETGVFHNRLTHSIKVSRIARIIARNLIEKGEKDDKFQREINHLGGLDVDVVEAAALAHDIGHPPFGHCGEKELDKLVLEYGMDSAFDRDQIDGFEGNAQSFRLLTKIIPRHTSFLGINATRATLNALLKYPWLYGESEEKPNKYGVYKTELEEFEWVRNASDIMPQKRTLEAEIMDWADDVAYALHDFEDFTRAGLIDFSGMHIYSHLGYWSQTQHTEERERYRGDILGYLKTLDPDVVGKNPDETLLSWVELMPYSILSNFTPESERMSREVFSVLIERSIAHFTIQDGEVYVPLEIRHENEILKQLTTYYVINSRTLQTQQHGYRKIIRYIFEAFFEESSDAINSTVRKSILPVDFQDLYEQEREINGGRFPDNLIKSRIIADCISRLTDDETLNLYQRLSGNAPGSIFERLR